MADTLLVFTDIIFGSLSFIEAPWIIHEVILKHILLRRDIYDIQTERFPVNCSRAAAIPCTKVRERSHTYDGSLCMVHQNSPTVEFWKDKIEGNLRRANTEPSVDFRRANTEPSVDFRKANTKPSVHFRRANTETY